MLFTEFELGDRTGQQSWHILKTRQTPLLPFALSGVGDYDCDRSYYTKRQGMEECLILYTLEGEGMVRYEEKEFTLAPGQLIALDCRKFHHYATKGERWHFLWFHFSGKCAFDYVELLNADGPGPLVLGKRYGFQKEYDRLAACALHFNLQAELEIAAIVQRLMTDLIDLKKRDVFSAKYGEYREALDESIVWMQQHFQEEITVDRLAEVCHLSKFYYIKVFRAYTGQTPYDYLLGFRLARAQAKLLETKKTVAQIAGECGFGDSKNFIACFKNRAGMTPLQYRKYIRPVHSFDGVPD